MRQWTLMVCVAAAMIAPLSSAQERPAPTPTETQTPAPTLRIGVTAVEVDTVVTDGSGRHIPDLKASDFELLQDGKPQTITSVRYVPVRAVSATNAAAGAKSAARPTPVPLTSSAQLQRDHAGRVMAIVIDDLSLTFMSMARLRDALDTFIDRDMRADDAVAIVLTSRGVGRLQQFTNDKAVLKETAARLGPNFFGRAFDNVDDDSDPTASQILAADTQEEVFGAGTLGAVQNIVHGMRDLPGRKSVVLVTEGFALMSRRGDMLTQRPQILDAFKRLVDESNRAFVVIHTVDARGVVNPMYAGFKAEKMGPPKRNFELMDMRNAYQDSRTGPLLLAEQAGGLSFAGNDYSVGFGKALADQEGYYVLGYQPDSATFDRAANKPVAFHQIKVRVKRSGLKARTRSGFFGRTDEEMRPEPRTPEQKLWAAASSPFIANDLGVHVTPLFGHTTSGDMFRVLLHVEGQGLQFTKTADGDYRAPVEMLAMPARALRRRVGEQRGNRTTRQLGSAALPSLLDAALRLRCL